jgi:hypothetical protein
MLVILVANENGTIGHTDSTLIIMLTATIEISRIGSLFIRCKYFNAILALPPPSDLEVNGKCMLQRNIMNYVKV